MTDTPLVVSSAYLNEHLNDPEVVVVDCRFSLLEPGLGSEQYQKSHITGAYYLDLNKDLSSPVQLHGGRHPLPNPHQLAEKIAAMGVKFSETLVVAYDDSCFAFAARLWWLLRYLGHDRISLLDGGWRGWQERGYPVTDTIPKAKSGRFIPQIRQDWVVDINQVKAKKDLPGVVLVDSRERDRYLGLTEPIDPIAGHIPGAVNYPWGLVTNEAGYIHSVAQQQQRWQDIPENQEIIVYCGSGVTACVNLLSLEIAGIKGGILYSGSWSDWCSYLE
ncbi:MAG TPA: sulfurtransferase [Cyanobacteria bacterium UBA9226]|nr:sulfurtransferase [Cyanobacteria bacterium UBA9226]